MKDLGQQEVSFTGHIPQVMITGHCMFYSRGGGGYSREFWIGVCREGSWTLTLFKDKESENWYPF